MQMQPGLPARTDERRPRHRRGRRAAFLVGSGLVAALVVGTVIVLRPEAALAPAAAVAEAADAVVDADTFRSTLVSEAPDGTREEASAELDGARARIVSQDDGQEVVTTVIGDQVWTTTAQGTSMRVAPPEERLAPFAESSSAALDAALTEAMVEDLGTEEVAGAEARHLRIELSDRSRAALFALAPSQLAWFDLEGSGSVEAIDVWLADGLVRQMRIEHAVQDDGSTYGGETVTIEFFDFGADITIEPPA
jgi:hypothetical protein